MQKNKCLLVSLPFTGFTNIPVLGLGILRAHALKHNIETDILDLNHSYFAKRGNYKHSANVNQFYQDYLDALPLPDIESSRIPSCLTPFSAFPYTFDEIDNILTELQRNPEWLELFESSILSQLDQIKVVGISLMGQTQVLIALLLAKLIKQHSPDTVIVAGGTHITLLQKKILKERNYGKYIDYFFPGHCEENFAGFLDDLIHKKKISLTGVVVAGSNEYLPYKELEPPKRLPPNYGDKYLNRLELENMIHPIQFRRGCFYGKCNFCTYHSVEDLDIDLDYGMMLEKYLSSCSDLDPKRFSVRDAYVSVADMKIIGQKISKYYPYAVWRASVKASNAPDVSAARELYALNCRTIEVGVETIHSHCQASANKFLSLSKIDEMLNGLVQAGIRIQLNLMFGFPNETLQDAIDQANWYTEWIEKYPDMIFGAINMLEVNEGSYYTDQPERFGLKLQPLGPWASNYCWNAPEWRERFFREYIVNLGNICHYPENAVKILYI
jgi:hypothetical protein